MLTLAVAQLPGVCGQGFGTRLVNLMKTLLQQQGRALEAKRMANRGETSKAAAGGKAVAGSQEAKGRGVSIVPPGNQVRCFMLTQADEGPKALNFWLKQKLSEGESAKHVLQTIHAADPKKNVWYDHATPMLCELNLLTTGTCGFVLPTSSPRAQTNITMPLPIPDKISQQNSEALADLGPKGESCQSPRTPELGPEQAVLTAVDLADGTMGGVKGRGGGGGGVVSGRVATAGELADKPGTVRQGAVRSNQRPARTRRKSIKMLD